MATLGAILAIYQKELRLMSRRAAVVVLMLIMPLLLIVVTSEAFGFVLGETGLGVVVVDLDGSARSEALVAELRETKGVELHVERWEKAAFERSDAERLLDDADGSAALVIPTGYGEDAGGQPLVLYVDPVQAGLSAIVRERVERVIIAGDIAQEVHEAVVSTTVSASAVDLRSLVTSTLAEPPVGVEAVAAAEEQAFPSAFEQSIPGFAVMFSLYVAAYVSLFIHYEKREWGTWRRALAAPLSAWTALSARILAYTSFGLLQIGVLFLFGWAVWNLSLGDSTASLLLTMVSVSLVSAGFGLFISVYAGRSLNLQAGLITLSLYALGVIGGAMVPVFLLPEWMQFVSRATPHFWALDAFQDIMIRGHGIVEILPSIGVLLAFAAALFAAATARFRFVD